MAGRIPTVRVRVKQWLQAELSAQAEELGIPAGVYISRLLEEGAGLRDMPFSWRHVGETRRAVQLAQNDHLEHVSGNKS